MTAMTMKSMMDKVMMTVIAADTNRDDDDDALALLLNGTSSKFLQRLELVPLLAVTLPVAVEKQ